MPDDRARDVGCIRNHVIPVFRRLGRVDENGTHEVVGKIGYKLVHSIGSEAGTRMGQLTSEGGEAKDIIVPWSRGPVYYGHSQKTT